MSQPMKRTSAYTSPTLAQSWELIGKVLRLRIKRYDARQVTAIRPDTGEVLGPLRPEPRWCERPLSWRMRKLILRAGLQASAEERLDPMPAWNAAVQSRVLGARRSRAKQRKASKDALLLAQHARLELTAQGGQPRPQASANGVQPTIEVVDEASSPHPASVRIVGVIAAASRVLEPVATIGFRLPRHHGKAIASDPIASRCAGTAAAAGVDPLES